VNTVHGLQFAQKLKSSVLKSAVPSVQLPTTQTDVSIDVGEPFVLFISFHPPSGSFSLNFNGESLVKFSSNFFFFVTDNLAK
jgi:hypothetical protein